jgi:hypothetical protein
MGFYIPEDGILHRHRRENLISYYMNIDPTRNPTFDPSVVQSVACPYKTNKLRGL